VAPEDMARKAEAISGPFGSTTATRSFLPIPKALSVFTVSSAWRRRARKGRGSRPGVAMAIASGLRFACVSSRWGRQRVLERSIDSVNSASDIVVC
jgi:hypothetical protein